MDLLYSGAFVRAVSAAAVALYEHLGPARHPLLRQLFGLCCTALGLGRELLARRHHYDPRELPNSCRSRLGRSCGSSSQPAARGVSHVRNGTHMDSAFKVWSCRGKWFWHVVNPHRGGGTIGAAASETDAIGEARLSIEEISMPGTAGSLAAHRRGRRDHGI